jgi:hypothetical protein
MYGTEPPPNSADRILLFSCYSSSLLSFVSFSRLFISEPGCLMEVKYQVTFCDILHFGSNKTAEIEVGYEDGRRLTGIEMERLVERYMRSYEIVRFRALARNEIWVL